MDSSWLPLLEDVLDFLPVYHISEEGSPHRILFPILTLPSASRYTEEDTLSKVLVSWIFFLSRLDILTLLAQQPAHPCKGTYIVSTHHCKLPAAGIFDVRKSSFQTEYPVEIFLQGTTNPYY